MNICVEQRLVMVFTALLVFLSGCQSMSTLSSTATGSQTKFQITLPADAETYRHRDPFVEAGIKALNEQNYDRASAAFNHALKLEPENPYLHFLNALTYHLMVRQGDTSKADLANVGYGLSYELDSTAWWNKYFSGLLSLEQRDYLRAQILFVRALLLDADNIEIMKGLITASYYLGDLVSALYVLEPALALQNNDAELLRSAALVYAAAGENAKAEYFLSAYSQLGLAEYKVNYIADRVHHWQKQNQTGAIDLHVVDSNAATSDSSTTDSNQETTTTTVTLSDRHVVVDVVIIRSEERVSDRRGINLLDGLSITFGASDTRTITDIGTGSEKGVAAAHAAGVILFDRFNFPNVFVRSISIPSVTYSLNIFNTIGDRNEILAKPSLMALDGEKSTFFSGAELTIGFAGTLQGGNLETKKVGVTLDVTPQFISDERVKLTVTAKRDFFEGFAPGSFEQSVRTSKNAVTASMVMNFGQTLILSGLTEKETESLENKVLILGDIPLIKTLFKQTDKIEFNKSIVFMLTPRRLTFVNESIDEADTNENTHADIIRNLLGQWRAQPMSTVAPSRQQRARLSSKARFSDVNYKGWNNKDNVQRAVNTALQRLYD